MEGLNAQIMKERAESVGGSLALDSRPGEGTRVVVCVPAEFVGSRDGDDANIAG